jgi:hypothetical protein
MTAEGSDEPRLSAAIMIPSLYLMARTEVPVTMGCLSADLRLEKLEKGGKDTLCVLRGTIGCCRLDMTAVMDGIGCVGVETVILLQNHSLLQHRARY